MRHDTAEDLFHRIESLQNSYEKNTEAISVEKLRLNSLVKEISTYEEDVISFKDRLNFLSIDFIEQERILSRLQREVAKAKASVEKEEQALVECIKKRNELETALLTTKLPEACSAVDSTITVLTVDVPSTIQRAVAAQAELTILEDKISSTTAVRTKKETEIQNATAATKSLLDACSKYEKQLHDLDREDFENVRKREWLMQALHDDEYQNASTMALIDRQLIDQNAMAEAAETRIRECKRLLDSRTGTAQPYLPPAHAHASSSGPIMHVPHSR